ncbi:PadR family transcriptional regulator [Salimicrobium halophilum]|uniref:DNA-binding transcriptional regulator, PadR family n=1 Tax=Salimicrobium halophilum TaxID=86666 RepID=A0A1G8W659_9BACI|nr:PadR family transcriptional regulator [Salimicrobium halophilum]SDJ73613.1 DNA-binding transcriptional regulator, PadR family [Salimicrobium halophilum]
MDEKDKWVIQLRKGVFEVAVLALISKHPMYGYQITRELKRIPVFEIPNGSIYPILNRITKNEWADVYWEESEDGPKRKYYRITKEGSEVLEYRLRSHKSVYEALMSLLEKGE